MPAERRTAFLGNIRTEAAWIQNLVERMLELAALENRQKPCAWAENLRWSAVEFIIMY